ncbi:MAG TPA: hypothetical protein VLU23_00095 [Pseudolabrys sp.]|nr:hypothetical protein [Pseudolabrys sp.]
MHAAAKLADSVASPRQIEALMLRVVTSFLTVLIIMVAANAAESDCGQTADLVAGHHRAAHKQKNSTVPPQGEERCGDYSNRFFEVVKARQAVSTCDDGKDHRRDLDVLDAQIDDLNNLIAVQCRGS